MNPLDLLGSPSITGGAAAPSAATVGGSSIYNTMNNPFSVAGSGARADATAAMTPQGAGGWLSIILPIAAAVVAVMVLK